MPDWLIQVLTSVTTVGAGTWFIQQYVISKIKNDFSVKLEKMRPLTAEETLRRENFLNAKRDAYDIVLDVATRKFASTKNWTGPGVPANRRITSEPPTEFEINRAAGNIGMFSDDPNIIGLYIKMFHHPSPFDLGNLLAALRADLGYGSGSIDPERYCYLFGGESEEQMEANATRNRKIRSK